MCFGNRTLSAARWGQRKTRAYIQKRCPASALSRASHAPKNLTPWGERGRARFEEHSDGPLETFCYSFSRCSCIIWKTLRRPSRIASSARTGSLGLAWRAAAFGRASSKLRKGSNTLRIASFASAMGTKFSVWRSSSNSRSFRFASSFPTCALSNWRRKEPNLAIGNQTNLVTPGTAIGASGASPHAYLGGVRSSLDCNACGQVTCCPV